MARYLATFVWRDSSDQTVIFSDARDIPTYATVNSSESDPIAFWSYDEIEDETPDPEPTTAPLPAGPSEDGRTRVALFTGNLASEADSPMLRNVYRKDDGTYQVMGWDGHGYEIGYYVVSILDDGTITTHTGDCLCANCATIWANTGDLVGADEGLDAAYQINGELGDTESVSCDHCHAVIYEPAGPDFDDETIDDYKVNPFRDDSTASPAGEAPATDPEPSDQIAAYDQAPTTDDDERSCTLCGDVLIGSEGPMCYDCFDCLADQGDLVASGQITSEEAYAACAPPIVRNDITRCPDCDQSYHVAAEGGHLCGGQEIAYNAASDGPILTYEVFDADTPLHFAETLDEAQEWADKHLAGSSFAEIREYQRPPHQSADHAPRPSGQTWRRNGESYTLTTTDPATPSHAAEWDERTHAYIVQRYDEQSDDITEVIDVRGEWGGCHITRSRVEDTRPPFGAVCDDDTWDRIMGRAHTVAWDPEKVRQSLNYDHVNIIVNGAEVPGRLVEENDTKRWVFTVPAQAQDAPDMAERLAFQESIFAIMEQMGAQPIDPTTTDPATPSHAAKILPYYLDLEDGGHFSNPAYDFPTVDAAIARAVELRASGYTGAMEVVERTDLDPVEGTWGDEELVGNVDDLLDTYTLTTTGDDLPSHAAQEEEEALREAFPIGCRVQYLDMFTDTGTVTGYMCGRITVQVDNPRHESWWSPDVTIRLDVPASTPNAQRADRDDFETRQNEHLARYLAKTGGAKSEVEIVASLTRFKDDGQTYIDGKPVRRSDIPFLARRAVEIRDGAASYTLTTTGDDLPSNGAAAAQDLPPGGSCFTLTASSEGDAVHGMGITLPPTPPDGMMWELQRDESWELIPDESPDDRYVIMAPDGWITYYESRETAERFLPNYQDQFGDIPLTITHAHKSGSLGPAGTWPALPTNAATDSPIYSIADTTAAYDHGYEAGMGELATLEDTTLRPMYEAMERQGLDSDRPHEHATDTAHLRGRRDAYRSHFATACSNCGCTPCHCHDGLTWTAQREAAYQPTNGDAPADWISLGDPTYVTNAAELSAERSDYPNCDFGEDGYAEGNNETYWPVGQCAVCDGNGFVWTHEEEGAS